MTRQRFDVGITDNVGVVQAQESLAGAEPDYINSVLAHNLAKLSLARAIGGSAAMTDLHISSLTLRLLRRTE